MLELRYEVVHDCICDPVLDEVATRCPTPVKCVQSLLFRDFEVGLVSANEVGNRNGRLSRALLTADFVKLRVRE